MKTAGLRKGYKPRIPMPTKLTAESQPPARSDIDSGYGGWDDPTLDDDDDDDNNMPVRPTNVEEREYAYRFKKPGVRVTTLV